MGQSSPSPSSVAKAVEDRSCGGHHPALETFNSRFRTKTTALIRFSLPKVAVGKFVAGTAFQVTLEMLRLLKRFKRDVDFQLPRRKLRGVITTAGIVFGDALFQVRGVSNVAILRMADAFNNVGVIHHAIFQDGGAEGVRTPDLLNAIQALYQLSYDPIRRGRNLKSPPRLSNILPAGGC